MRLSDPLSLILKMIEANNRLGRLAPETRGNAFRIDHYECFGGTVRCFYINGTGAFGSVTKLYSFLLFSTPRNCIYSAKWNAVKR